jgi:hypothetical protein
MFWTHHFAHHETLNRARSWLMQLGFAPDRLEVHANGVPRLALTVDPLELAAVEMVVNVAERTDPQGWPSFWDVARQDHVYPAAAPEPPSTGGRSGEAIGWHPPD